MGSDELGQVVAPTGSGSVVRRHASNRVEDRDAALEHPHSEVCQVSLNAIVVRCEAHILISHPSHRLPLGSDRQEHLVPT